MLRNRWMQTALVTAALELLVTAGIAAQDKVVHPRGGAPGQWRAIGQVNANLTADHDEIIVRGPGRAPAQKLNTKETEMTTAGE
jgi:hypothetical protein